jgi:hypothetical protein
VVLGLVEVIPHRIHHRIRQEMHMHIHQPGQSKSSPPVRHLVIAHQTNPKSLGSIDTPPVPTRRLNTNSPYRLPAEADFQGIDINRQAMP